MGFLYAIEEEYRQNKNYGVTFSIDAEAYECKVGDRIRFGENETVLQCGSFYNYQDVLLDGNKIGYLEEVDNG